MDKKQEILKAAFEIFCEKGYYLSVAELAQAVNIKTPSLYSHFASKDEIIEQVVDAEIQRFYKQLREQKSKAGPGCEKAMRAVFEFVIVYFSKGKRLRFWRAIPFIPNQTLKDLCTERIRENDMLFFEQMEACFGAGKNQGEIRPDVPDGALRLYLCMIQGVLDGMLMHAPESRRSALILFDAYWDGISQKTDKPRKRRKETSGYGL